MAKENYRVDGMSTAQVKELQKMLGVTADGAWGNQSKAALARAYGASADPLSVFTAIKAANTAQSRQASTTTSTLPNGYTGSYYTGKDGNNYTDYGALLRNDGFDYSSGGKISPNGMYVDAGNGWQFAKRGVAFDGSGRVLGYANSSVTGLAPGARVPGDWSSGGAGSTDPGAANPDPDATEPKSEWELFLERELKRYTEELLSGYWG